MIISLNDNILNIKEAVRVSSEAQNTLLNFTCNQIWSSYTCEIADLIMAKSKGKISNLSLNV